MYIHPWNHHHNQNKKIHHPLTFPHEPFQSLPPPISLLFLWQLLICFQWLRINSRFLELYINGIIKYVLVFVWFLSLRVSILRFIYFLVCSNSSKITADGDCSHEIKRSLLFGRKVMTNLDSIFKSRDITLPTKVHQAHGFSSGHVWMWELDYKESWAPPKNWCFWTVVLEKTLKGPLDCKEIQPVHSKGD